MKSEEWKALSIMNMYMKKPSIILLGLLFVFASSGNAQELPQIQKAQFTKSFREAIETIRYDFLGTHKGKITLKQVDKHTLHVKISIALSEPVPQDDWRLLIQPAFKPKFNWAPHLTPTSKNIIAQHVFRSPALIAADEKQLLIVVPDLELINKQPPVRWYMDMDAPNNLLTLGMSNSRVTDHVIYERQPGGFFPAGVVEFGFYLMVYTDSTSLKNPFRRTASFFWKHWGSQLFLQESHVKKKLSTYVNHTYHWAFHSWKDAVWQQFQLNQIPVGAATFIVNTTQSPNYPGRVDEREFRSVWNQAWFSSLRSASGLYRYARRTGNDSLKAKALMTKELALSFPKKKGFFYGLIATEMEQIEIEEKKYNRSKGWDTYYWGNSNRNPYTWNPRQAPFHLLDMSWTSLWMLRWYEDLEKDQRLLQYAQDYANALISVQFDNGFFPGWLDLATLKPMQHLNDSPESSISVTFLLTLYRITKNLKYKMAALKAMEAVMKHVILDGRWEDFETYWSCSRIGSQDWVGKKIIRNNMYKQNNLSMFWTAEALLESYRSTGLRKYLQLGQRTLDELLMTQASWQPYFIPFPALGGFGVMNADGEWNDARQSLFAELIIHYGTLLKSKEYIQRGLSALRASFTMMYCPENPEVKIQWEKKWPFFGKEDYGFTMENYGHDGVSNADGLGIGEFTIYDWGNGAAAEAYNRIVDLYPELEIK